MNITIEKQKEREALAKDIKAFLAKGGKIKKVKQKTEEEIKNGVITPSRKFYA